MHAHVRHKLTLACCFLLLVCSAACSHAPGRVADMNRFFRQEHLGLSAGDEVALESEVSVDPAVERSRKQVQEGLSKNTAYYRGDFDDDYGDEGGVSIADPIKPWNVFWFYFNDGLYHFVLRPLGQGYNYVVPQPVRQGVLNFFYNLKFPIRFINNLLQGKVTAAGVEMSRFLGNTLFGGLGVMDITEYKKAAAETPPEDFGQTLGAWGVGDGFYIVWPIYGPSSVRDSIGQGVDILCDPLTYIDPWYLNYENPWWWYWTAAGARTFTATADRIDAYDALRDAAIDPYTAFRNAYFQNRRRQVNQ